MSSSKQQRSKSNKKVQQSQGSTTAPVEKGAERAASPSATVAQLPAVTPPLFRKVDWLAFSVTTLFMLVAYFVTLAPNLTLEDSGELAVGSFYAGVPHPPGYPVWTIFSWLFSVLIPVSNIAWRVALFSAVSGALTCGLLSLIVSRGSSMMIEGVRYLETIDRRWENYICFVSGFVAGTLLGFNGFMWSQAVIVEVYTFSHLSLVGVLACLLRWIYAPHQRRYLYYAMFLFGICFTNHQSLLLAAVGIEIAILAAQPKLGRDLFAANSILYILGLIAKAKGHLGILNPHATFIIFNVIGLGSIGTFAWAAITTKKIGTEWKAVLIMGAMWAIGAAFYFYMPVTSMTNPPMNWAYPRTEEGFYHALERGQYEQPSATDVLGDPMRFVRQLLMYFDGTIEEFNLVYFIIALVPYFFFKGMRKREKAWLIGLTAILLCLSVLMLIMLNPALDRQSRSLVRVFFTASHVLVALLIGYGLTLIAATLATHYQRFRPWAIGASVVAAGIALFGAAVVFQSGDIAQLSRDYPFGLSPSRDTLIRFTSILGLGMSLAAVALFALSRKRLPVLALLGIFIIFPLKPMFSNWAENEQRGHMFGYWFGHDMFTPPFGIYPEMEKHTVLFGGTDPGRFCPTYMIFCESFIPPEDKKDTDPEFDRRDVYIITQNALADGTYLSYIRAHYNRSAQIDPPFFQELLRSDKESKENYKTNIFARMVSPLDDLFLTIGDRVERRRRAGTSFFDAKDFLDLPAFADRLKPRPDQDPVSKFVFEHLDSNTQKRITSSESDASLARALATDLNRLIEAELVEKKKLESDVAAIRRKEKDYDERERLIAERRAKFEETYAPLYAPERFVDVKLSEHVKLFIAEDPQSHTRIRLNRLLLEETYPNLIAKSPGGLYPDIEIQTPSVEDSQRCFNDYLQDAQRRLQTGQLKPGEDVKLVPDASGQQRVQVSGQVAVMAINGLLTKVIFDKNPGHEFYVEESFPLDWMFPHLSPYGIIMKINREPLDEITQDMVDKDHEFWSQYSERLIGNWITYDTTVQDIADFIDKVYLRHDQSGLNAEQRKFARDDQAQKAFSKLRSSIGGIYNYRIGNAHTPAEQQRMIKEADFTFKQAFAYCPYSPEAVFRFVQLLMGQQRIDDALIVAQTCLRLDPYNGQVQVLVENLKNIQTNLAGTQVSNNAIATAQSEIQRNPSNIQAYVTLANNYMQRGHTNLALAVVDQMLTNPAADASAIMFAAQAYIHFQQYGKLDSALQRMVEIEPGNPEAWYNLAALKAVLGQTKPAIEALRKALEFNQDRLASNLTARDLRQDAATNQQFGNLRNLPEFKELISPK